ncbi:MAG: flavodoxin-dependent (E)-4-hydroxy-3-methylbut-2-enyl-diphosphate synthase, partial [Firmicutes bacterium]|nr:flavodoxin-dependent (E)-4-hydroxy-3-methylbut-2-enyl-diphosphate synthase [Bacillota bacterium]
MASDNRIKRRDAKAVSVGGVKIGGANPIVVQSMTNTDTRDAAATVAQVKALAAAGCGIVRCACPDTATAEALKTVVRESPVPIVADIHFDYRLALASIEAGVAKVRINPGNIGGDDRLAEVIKA